MMEIIWTSRFKKDYKLALKRGLPIESLDEVIRSLAGGEPLPDKYRDHVLANNWRGHRECHVQPDWLLIYKVDHDVLAFNSCSDGQSFGSVRFISRIKKMHL